VISQLLRYHYTIIQREMDATSHEGIATKGQTIWDCSLIDLLRVGFAGGQSVLPVVHVTKNGGG
jgi:hypothetical protein